MNCREARQHWHLYHDSEGEAELHFQIADHLSLCEDCATWFGRQDCLHNRLAAKLRASRATPQLWAKVLVGAGVSSAPSLHRGLLQFGIAAGMAAAAIAVAVSWIALGRWRQGDDLSVLITDHHRRLTAGQVAVQFVSRSDREVEGFLRRQVSFPVRCPPRKDAGFAVNGAGVCALGDQQAAYLTGSVDQQAVSIFILPREGLNSFPRQQHELETDRMRHAHESEYAVVFGIMDRNAVLVVGQATPPQLERVFNAYGTYPDHD
jgi:hypothetical protein